MDELAPFVKYLKETYICPVCAQKSRIRAIEVEIISVIDNVAKFSSSKANWQWKCSYRKCPASEDWQTNLEPAIRKNRAMKIGYEGGEKL